MMYDIEAAIDTLAIDNEVSSHSSSYHYGSNNCLESEVTGDVSEVKINDIKPTFSTLQSFSIDNNNHNDDYGFFEELEMCVDDVTSHEDIGSTTQASSLTNCQLSSTTTKESTSQKVINESSSQTTVVCELENRRAPVACRSFERKLNRSSSHVEIASTCCSIEGFRIIQDSFHELPEYKVKLTIDDKEYISWRKYHDFEALAEACLEFRNDRQLLISCLDDTELNSTFKKTILAWHKVESNRPWWCTNITVDYISMESALLINFMKQLLFETPSVEILIEFMS